MRDVNRLRDHVENQTLSVGDGEAPAQDEIDDDEFEVLRESPEFVDGKFKLEICTCCIYSDVRHSRLTA